MRAQDEAAIIAKGIEISWTTWGKMRGETLVLGDVSYVKSETDKGFERIFAVSITGNTDTKIQQMVSAMKAGSIPDSMLITPKTKPSNLAEILRENGFSIHDSDPCMLLYLDDYIGRSPSRPTLEIAPVTDKAQLKEWLAIVSTALFGCELVTPEQFGDIMQLENTYFYLGSVGGIPVTACMTITAGDTSVLEMVATLPAYRRNGYASAVIDQALRDLQRKGIQTISLRAEADGVGVYRRLGFKECFRRIVASCN